MFIQCASAAAPSLPRALRERTLEIGSPEFYESFLEEYIGSELKPEDKTAAKFFSTMNHYSIGSLRVTSECIYLLRAHINDRRAKSTNKLPYYNTNARNALTHIFVAISKTTDPTYDQLTIEWNKDPVSNLMTFKNDI